MMESFAGNILVVDDDGDIREVLGDRLQSLGYRVFAAETAKMGLELLERQNPQLVLLDIEMPDMNGIDMLREIRRREHDVTVVMITAYGTIERAVEAMKEGAYDFIPKPFEPDHVALIVGKALERETLRRGIEILSEQIDDRHRMIVGQSEGIRHAVDTAKKAARSAATVLLLGESGTGKEVFARAIHNWSQRRDHPFVAINSVGLSSELLESELFGHEQGAFTGAHRRKRGRLEVAHGGTIFFDEIGDLARELQAKLLRFLQEREFERVGGVTQISVDVRVIAATNRDLERSVKEGFFREDLYHRLNVVPITLPPLRERREDIQALAHHFLQKHSRAMGRNVTEIPREAQERLQEYDWPGNVRELGNVIERAVVLGSSGSISVEDLPSRIAAGTSPSAPGTSSYREAVNAARRLVIVNALAATHGNRAAAAKRLGLEAKYLLKLIKSLRIE